MCSTSIQVPLTDDCESNRCFPVNLCRAIHESARILAINNPDSNCRRIKCDWPDALILYLAEEHNCIVGWESVHFLDRSDHVAVVADIRYLALFIALLQLWLALFTPGRFLGQL